MKTRIKYQVSSIKYERGNGFSLIELILYVALLSIIITGMVGFGISAVLIRSKSRVEQEVVANARLVSKRINYEIRNALDISSVGLNSITLTSTDLAKNPTVISFSGGRVLMGFGASGSCPVNSPCPLTSSSVTVQSLEFTDMSGDVKPKSVKYELVVKSEISGSSKTYYYKQYATGSAEVRSK